MNQQKWERDIINRQRNIVFPDTVLNEGRFYRNIASGKAVFSTGQKVSIVLMLTYSAVISSLFLAGSINEYLAKHDHGLFMPNSGFIFSVWPLFFWTFLTVKGLSPAPQAARKRRRGYRSSGSRAR